MTHVQLRWIAASICSTFLLRSMPHDLGGHLGLRNTPPITNHSSEQAARQALARPRLGRRRTQVCRTLGRGEAAAPELERLTTELNEAYQRTAPGLSANAAARIERTGGRGRLVLTGLDKIHEPASLVELRTLVQALMPRVDLPELLLEVNAGLVSPTSSLT